MPLLTFSDSLATFLHQVFVLSPEGEYLLKLVENVNRLIPYMMVKQTLRVSNAATMISGMMRLLLAKLSLTSLSNWAGLTSNPDDGMNLLQRCSAHVRDGLAQTRCADVGAESYLQSSRGIVPSFERAPKRSKRRAVGRAPSTLQPSRSTRPSHWTSRLSLGAEASRTLGP